MQEVISAIDIGTTKICALMAAVEHDSLGNITLNMLGEGRVASGGIRRRRCQCGRGDSMRSEAVEKCEKASGEPLVRAYVGTPVATSMRATAQASAQWTNGTVCKCRYAATGSCHRRRPAHQHRSHHTIARQWKVDGQDEVATITGMSAIRLSWRHIVTGSSTAVNNLVQCITAHEIEVDELLEPLASNKLSSKPMSDGWGCGH